ncbi:tRNA pseudouridine(55) synthase TruB, partial [Patescibacteria group bacterium]|nr:tRNA pseudouridine(55) synthase TruB [Patescibacteria group bacterium]
ARDIGDELGVGGYLADLERTRVGQFVKEDAVRLKI